MLNGLINLKILIYSFILFFSSFLNISFFSQIKKEIHLQKNEKIIVTFFNNYNCIKCYISERDVIDKIKNNIKYSLKYITFVKCDRKIELNAIKEQFELNDFLFVDDNSSKYKLGLKNNTAFAILNYNGKILLEINQNDLLNVDSSYKRIFKILKIFKK